MIFELKKSFNAVLVFIVLLVMALLIGFGCGILSQGGIFLIPLAVCVYFLSLAYVGGKYKLFSLLMLLASAIVEAVVSGLEGYTCLCAGCIAFIFYFFCSSRLSKSHAVAYSVLLTFSLGVLYLYFVAVGQVNSFMLSDVSEFYAELIANVREDLWSVASKMTVKDITGVETQRYTQTDFNSIFDSFVLLSPGILAIICLLLVGVSSKLIRLSVRLVGADNGKFNEWRFSSGRFFAYFYVILAILYMLSYGSDIITLTLDNLYLFFMILYAYIGVGPAIAFLSRRNDNKLLAFILLIVAFLIFGYTTISLLSLIGVFSSINSKDNGADPDADVGKQPKG